MRNLLWTTVATLLVCAASACAIEPAEPSGTEADRRRPRVDASVQPDAPPPADPAATGAVSCYASYAPAATCAAPEHCCFTNYSAQHDGACTTASCPWGTIRCDGPEDCAAGETCCSTALYGPDGIAGYRLACQAKACAAAPEGYELCHTSATCEAGERCVSVWGIAPELPRALSVCQ